MCYERGDIIWVDVQERDPNKIRHPAIIWDYYKGYDEFTGIMLTHSPPSDKFNNILMREEHFVKGRQVVFNNTHFVNQLFTKFNSWGPFYIAGKLTSVGVQFIADNMTNNGAIEFMEYLPALNG